MTYPAGGGATMEAFLSQVRDAAGVTTAAEAERVARATLSTLAEQITEGEMDKLTVALPPEVRDESSGVRKQARSFGKDAFLDAITGQIDTVSLETAEYQVRGVLRVVKAWVPDGELDAAVAQLPPDMVDLFS